MWVDHPLQKSRIDNGFRIGQMLERLVLLLQRKDILKTNLFLSEVKTVLVHMFSRQRLFLSLHSAMIEQIQSFTSISY